MDNQDDLKAFSPYMLLYVKRPDLRPAELPTEGTPEEFDARLPSWQWWISSSDLYTNELKSNHEEFLALALPEYPDISGTPDPAKIIAYFCACHDWGVYPPAWIMNDLYKRFSGYLDDNMQGKFRGLGEYFGEPAKGTRSGTFRKFQLEPAMETACMNVDRLEHWCNRPLNKALDIVALQLEEAQERAPEAFKVDPKKRKGREALRKAHQEWRRSGCTDRMLDFWKEKEMPTSEQITEFVKALGPDLLTGHPDLLALLRK